MISKWYLTADFFQTRKVKKKIQIDFRHPPIVNFPPDSPNDTGKKGQPNGLYYLVLHSTVGKVVNLLINYFIGKNNIPQVFKGE